MQNTPKNKQKRNEPSTILRLKNQRRQPFSSYCFCYQDKVKRNGAYNMYMLLNQLKKGGSGCSVDSPSLDIRAPTTYSIRDHPNFIHLLPTRHHLARRRLFDPIEEEARVHVGRTPFVQEKTGIKRDAVQATLTLAQSGNRGGKKGRGEGKKRDKTMDLPCIWIQVGWPAK